MIISDENLANYEIIDPILYTNTNSQMYILTKTFLLMIL